MVVIDLGARIIKVNQSLLRKDIDPHSHIEVPVSGVPEEQGVSAPEAAELTNDECTSYSHAHWQCAMAGKIDVLEFFAGSARVSQCAEWVLQWIYALGLISIRDLVSSGPCR